ncbi:receptor-like protein 56 isoform X2 [Gossypium hirsutum]|uniref:Receptor-like protein 56 isoform X2 n=1 Tax=Gossypium hirsutum TaxID=3635 RepID=A0ABM2ZMW9_GOSHI|nr:receptor-like protein 56 isoform X2 [Gossypium hirsutum]
MRNLSSLKTLRLSSNQLEGRLLHIQGLSNLINLKKLDLSENQIESLQFSKDGGRKLELTHLKELNLNSNLFNNSVFASLNKLLNLKTLSISNQLKGPIDTKDLDAFTSLRELNMRANELIDFVIHKGWCDLRNLEVLDVSGNALEGMLPHCFSNLTALRVLDISRNHFQIPLSFAPFANLSNLKALLSNENKMVTEPSFYTSIPKFQFEVISLSKCITSQQLSRKLPTFLYYQYDLRYVDLSHNNFSGTVPSWLLENNTKLEDLILKGNSFTSPLSFSSALISNVSSIDISENKIQGQIPTSTCSTFPHLSRLFLSKNLLKVISHFV